MLGNFDGVHLGHRVLFEEANRHGPAAALTFEPHPGKVLQPELAPKRITLFERKLELLEEAGVEVAIVQPFDLPFARTPPEAFERSLFDLVAATHAVVGHDFTYGRGRAGNAASLARAARSRNARVHVVAPVTLDGVVVSSSKVREYVLEGRVKAAKRLLGRYFDLDGVVVRGDGRGRSIGFPTANVETANELRPGPGVYAVRVRLATGGWLPGAANIGVKPTFGGTEVTVEVHLIGFSGEIYGERVRVAFVDLLRAEKRFRSVEELAAQIRKDVDEARSRISAAGAD